MGAASQMLKQTNISASTWASLSALGQYASDVAAKVHEYGEDGVSADGQQYASLYSHVLHVEASACNHVTCPHERLPTLHEYGDDGEQHMF